jgi:hypothetical protein
VSIIFPRHNHNAIKNLSLGVFFLRSGFTLRYLGFMVCYPIQGEMNNTNQILKNSKNADTFTTCTATRKEIKYAYPPDAPVPHARVVASSSFTSVEVAVFATCLPPADAQQLTVQQALRALDIFN